VCYELDVRTPDEKYRPVGETHGDVDPHLDMVIDLETVRPLIAALSGRRVRRWGCRGRADG
jgi:RNA polymerase sigma-B factor